MQSLGRAFDAIIPELDTGSHFLEPFAVKMRQQRPAEELGASNSHKVTMLVSGGVLSQELVFCDL